MIAKHCPECGATLQRLMGAEGYPVVPCIELDDRQQATGRVVLVEQRLHAIYACTNCEHVEKGGAR